MSTTMTYGGWVTERPAATGVTSTLVRWVGWMTAAGAALTSVGTGGELSPQQLQRSAQQAQHMVSVVDVAEIEKVRTPGENLLRIREVLKPAISDRLQLAKWRTCCRRERSKATGPCSSCRRALSRRCKHQCGLTEAKDRQWPDADADCEGW